MSSGNPYAVNGYAPTNATNSNVSGRYGDIYSQQANAYSGSVNSAASRDRRRRDDVSVSQMNEQPPQPLFARQRHGGGSEDYGRRPSTGLREADYNNPDRLLDRRAMGSGANGYSLHSPRRTAKSMEEVLQHIQGSWKDLSGDDCVPVQMALKLMDPSSLGLADKELDFQQTHVDLQKTLKSIVNEHHQDFNSSIGTYHKIQASIQASQSRVRYLKQALAGAQAGLLTTKPELKGLATSSQELDDTLQLFGQIESIQAVPERLEARISEKRFLTAVDVLQDALRLVRKSELDGIGAIADSRTYFANQEQSLTDILIEELHDHLYLKSPYCQDRWKAKTADGEEKDAQASMTANSVNSWDKPVYHYLASLDTKTPMVEDASRNPEADTFYYIHMIIESLSRLGRLEDAISRIEQRMPVELYKVVEKTNNDVDSRHPSHLRGQLNKDHRQLLAMHANDGRGAVLSDFLWTLYSKFEAIAQGHRVLHEVVSGIVAREQLPTPEKYTGGFKELWKLYQMEMRSLLHDYLATDGDVTLRTGVASTAGGDVFTRNQRDRSKRIFKLSEMDQQSSDMKSEQAELDEILKTSVPGLVSKSRAKTGVVSSAERSGTDSSSAGHKLLIEPSVFNMTILLSPSLAFLQHLRDIVPVSSNIPMSTLTSFLDDFLINIFHPQLEEAVTELCTQCIIDLEAFSEDPQWSKYSPRPIFRGTFAFISLIYAFAGMLSSIPQDQIFTQLIISQLVTYYDKCHGFYKGLVSRLAPSPASPNTNIRTLKAAAAYAESGEIHDVASALFNNQSIADRAARFFQIDKEVQLLLSATKASPLSAYDNISDPRSVHNLSLLYNSMQWLSSSVTQLRHVDSSISSKRTSRSRRPSTSRRWTLITNLKAHSKSAATPVQLPLSFESAIPFDTTLSSFRTLSQAALLTLHIDIRCGVIYQLTRSLRGADHNSTTTLSSDQFSSGQTASSYSTITSPTGLRDSTSTPVSAGETASTHFLLPAPPISASPLVLDLNADLIAFDTNISTYLGRRERRFITSGLSRLVDRLLIVGAEWVGAMNKHGAERMQLDGIVLQQNLRNITAAARDMTDGALAVAAAGRGAMGGSRGLGISSGTTNAVADDTNSSDDDEDLLTRSTQYYALFLAGPDHILQFVEETKKKDKAKKATAAPTPPPPSETTTGSADNNSNDGNSNNNIDNKDDGDPGYYSYDELRTLIELCYSAALRSGDREESVRARKSMGDVLLRLGELMWDS